MKTPRIAGRFLCARAVKKSSTHGVDLLVVAPGQARRAQRPPKMPPGMARRYRSCGLPVAVCTGRHLNERAAASHAFVQIAWASGCAESTLIASFTEDPAMKRLLPIILAVAPFTALSVPAHAQYTGPGAHAAVTTVTEARSQRDDQPVVLRGTLIAKEGHERYRFKDATGEIEVEIDDDDLPHHAPISADTVVELRGEVDTHRFKPTDIDVDHVRVVPGP